MVAASTIFVQSLRIGVAALVAMLVKTANLRGNPAMSTVAFVRPLRPNATLQTARRAVASTTPV